MIVYRAIGNDGSIYVGATTKPLHARRAAHKSAANRGSAGKFHQSIRDNGIDFFKFEPVALCKSMDEMDFMEKAMICYFDSCVNGLNGTFGGRENRKHIYTDKFRRAVSKNMKSIHKLRPDIIAKARKNSLTPEKQRARSLIAHANKKAKCRAYEIIDTRDGKSLGVFKGYKEAAKLIGTTGPALRTYVLGPGKTKHFIFKYVEG